MERHRPGTRPMPRDWRKVRMRLCLAHDQSHRRGPCRSASNIKGKTSDTANKSPCRRVPTHSISTDARHAEGRHPPLTTEPGHARLAQKPYHSRATASVTRGIHSRPLCTDDHAVNDTAGVLDRNGVYINRSRATGFPAVAGSGDTTRRQAARTLGAARRRTEQSHVEQ